MRVAFWLVYFDRGFQLEFSELGPRGTRIKAMELVTNTDVNLTLTLEPGKSTLSIC